MWLQAAAATGLGVAAAFGDVTQLRAELQQFVTEYFHTADTNQPCFKLARVPSCAKLEYPEDRATGQRTRFPVVRVNNVYILPGVPRLLERAFLLLAKEHFVNTSGQFSVDTVYLALDEVSVVAALNVVVAQCGDVTIGSYPELDHNYYKTRITLEASDPAAVAAARQRLTAALPAGAVVNYTPHPIDGAAERLAALAERDPHVTEAVQLMEKCLDEYQPEQICVCFNGGKDCTAVLHLAHALLRRRSPASRLRALYIRESRPFPAMERFVEETRVRYDLDLFSTPGPLKTGLLAMLARWPHVRATVMGTRQADPRAGRLRPFQPTDADWPPLMRVSPLLSWDYAQLWSFIRTLSVAYCCLYDQGYTSLGCVDTTLPNPALRHTDADGRATYRPAHQLEDAGRERDGRRPS